MRGNGCLGKKEERFRKMDPRLLKITMTAMQNQKTVTQAIGKRLGIATPTLYMYVNGNGSFKEAEQQLLLSLQKKIHFNEPILNFYR